MNQSNFIKTAFLSLTQEQFDNVVKLFQKHYMHNTAVLVNGTNDMGKDLVIYKNKKEVNIVVQITIEKNVESKLKRELHKVKRLIDEFNYSDKYEFYCNSSLSEGKVEKLKKLARDEYGIELDLFDGKRLAQLPCPKVCEYIYGLYEKGERGIVKIDESEQVLFDLLTKGNSSSDIKKGLIQSVIIFVIFEKGNIQIGKLQKLVESRLKKSIPNIQSHLSSMIQNGRVRNVNGKPLYVELTENESKQVSEIYVNTQYTEKNFTAHIKSILDKYGINDYATVMTKLQELYKTNYQYDIDEVKGEATDFEKAKAQIYFNFESYIKQVLPNQESLPNLIQEIKKLCDTNNYMNRSMIGGAFISLYASDKLESYVNTKKKRVFLDTPVFIYVVCSMICKDYDIEWNNLYYNSTKSLVAAREEHSKIEYCVFENYVMEAFGELRKAVSIGWMEEFNYSNELGVSRNTFYLCYQQIKKSAILDVDEKLDTFEDFLYTLGIDSIYPDSQQFRNEALDFLYDCAQEAGIIIIKDYEPSQKDVVKKIYENILSYEKKAKSSYAVESDVKQTLYLMDESNFLDPLNGYPSDAYLSTWDDSFFELRRKLFADSHRQKHFFYIQNPSKLANRFAIENFNIDGSCISNDIFMYAEQEFQLSSKVKSLIDIIASLLRKKEERSVRWMGELRRIRKQELNSMSKPDSFETNPSSMALVVDDVIAQFVTFIRDRKYKSQIEDFTNYLFDESNYDVIINEMRKALQAAKQHQRYDLGSKFIQLVQSVNN